MTASISAPFQLRLMKPEDRNFVFATWMESARDCLNAIVHDGAHQLHENVSRSYPEKAYSAFLRADVRVPSTDVWSRAYPKFVESLLDTEVTVILYREESPLVIDAWACGRPPSTLHWAYVPLPVRGQGLGRQVVTGALGAYHEAIYVTSPFGKQSAGRFTFNPFGVR